MVNLSDVQHNSEGFTLSPSMTLAEFRREVIKINNAIEHVASERGRREAQRVKVAS